MAIELTTVPVETSIDVADEMYFNDVSETPDAMNRITFANVKASILAGVIDAGGATSFEIPNSAAPTVDADGEIALDTTVTDFSHGIIKYYGGEEMAVVALPIAELTTPTNGHVVAYNATTDEFELVAAPGGGTTILKAYQTADAVYVTDDTFNNTDLNVTVDSSGVYDVDIQFTLDNGAGWFKLDFNGGTATMTNVRLYASACGLVGAPQSTFASASITSIATSTAFGTTEEVKGVQIRGCIEVNAGGTFILRGCQFSSNADSTTIYRGATMVLTKLN